MVKSPWQDSKNTVVKLRVFESYMTLHTQVDLRYQTGSRYPEKESFHITYIHGEFLISN